MTKWRTLVAVSLAALLMLLGVTTASVALPDIQRDLGASFNDLRWVIDAYALALAATALISGSLADRYGRLRMFRLGLLVFGAASIASGFALSAVALDVFRVFQGIGGAAMFATSLALISTAYSGRDRHLAFGFWGGMTAGAMAIGPLVGGGLISAFGWEATFFVNVPVVALIWWLVARGVPDSRDLGAHGRPDVPGLISIAGAMTLLVLALFRGDDWGWGSAATIGAVIGALALLALFVVIETRTERPLLDLTLYRKPSISGASIGIPAISFSVFATFTFLTLYIQSTLGHTPAGTGLRLFVLTISSFIAAMIAGRVVDRIHLRAQFAFGLALIGAGLLLMVAQVNATSEWTALLAGGVVVGAGTGIALFAGSNVALAAAPRAQSGMAAGLNTTFRMLGLAVGIAALGTILQGRVAVRLGELLPGLDSAALVDLTATGNVELAAATAPLAARADVAAAAQSAFVTGLEVALLVAAAVAFVSAVAAFVLVRSSDLQAEPAPEDSADSVSGSASDRVHAAGDGVGDEDSQLAPADKSLGGHSSPDHAVARLGSELELAALPPGAAPDTTAPTITLKGKKTQKGSRLVVVKVTAEEAATAVGTGTIEVPVIKGSATAAKKKKSKKKKKTSKKSKLKGQTKEIVAGEVTILMLKLKKKPRRLTKKAQRKGKNATARVTVSVIDAAGNATTLKRTIKLRKR